MGIILFGIAATLEGSFAMYCIITKSNQDKKRRYLRIISFLSLVLLILLSIVQWNFRVYLLVYLLALLSFFAIVRLIQKKEHVKEFKTSRIVMKTMGMIVLFFLASVPAILFPQHIIILQPTGKYHVVTSNMTYIDSKRIEDYSKDIENRSLNVQFWYPDNENQTFPLIVFSHGGLGVKSSNETLYNELASHGYVVLSIDHTYHSFFTKDEDGGTTWIDYGYFQQMLRENPLKNMEQSFDYYQQWMKIRVDDINFVIDTTISKAKEAQSDTPFDSIDVEKIGVMGHSTGGSAALGIGRIRDDVQAIVALESPLLMDIEGIKDNAFVFNEEAYPLPVLNVYSDSSWEILDKRPQYVANYAMLSNQNPNVQNAYIKGIGHLSLTDFSLTSPILTRMIDGQKSTIKPEEALRKINELCLNFLNSVLKTEEDSPDNGFN